ncbi:hypothetical protein [Nocardiopsis sp. FR4]|uniref:hypothetical protein n=1 Tax=Nocardiopsis sp. FR4 TaxID=2605985 RepID=UPI00135BD90F|nr:hypothetical protein [Nocardiopsis sp. FR4]
MDLLRLLWESGVRTRSSCQDYGALLAMTAPGLPVGDQRWVDFYTGRVWVEMDAAHAEDLAGRLSRDGELRLAMSQWGMAESWVWTRPILPDLVGGRGRTADSAHVFFPRHHLQKVLNVLQRGKAPNPGARPDGAGIVAANQPTPKGSHAAL